MNLYLKYRPKRFKDIVGQEHIVRVLKNAFKSGNISHAYLFSGPRGSGKTSTARIIARALNCKDLYDFEPCLKCENCKAIDNGNFLDLIEIDAASNRNIDDIRNLRERVIFAPQIGRYKVYIIDEVHMLTPQAFNAFLKVLEEPPEHSIFILATTEPEKLLPTIISRCQRHSFKRISTELIADYLMDIWNKESKTRNLPRIDRDALLTIAKLSDGAMRDALSLLEQLFYIDKSEIIKRDVAEIYGILSEDMCEKIFMAINNKDFKGVKLITDNLLFNGISHKYIIQSMIDFVKNRILNGKTDGMVLLENLILGLEKLRWHPFPDEIIDLIWLKSIYNSNNGHNIIEKNKDSIKIDKKNIVNKKVLTIDSIRECLKRIDERLNNLLSKADVTLDGERLNILFYMPFDYNYFVKFKKQDKLKSIISNELGYNLKIEVNLSVQEGEDGREIIKYPPLVEKTLKFFGGEVVNITEE